MARYLPPTYSLLLFVVPSLLLSVSSQTLGFVEPASISELVILPAVITLFANIGHAVRATKSSTPVVDEEDVQAMVHAVSASGGVALVSLLGLSIWYAIKGARVPGEVTILMGVVVGTLLFDLFISTVRTRTQ